ncbi:DUF6053 domain-containing protein [Lysobacter enzymogenes]|uniref:DUF6053 domain-containing protein n=1 Tax=Lysobacter enzymogenes TaxID=69 RepID=UPI003D18BA52
MPGARALIDARAGDDAAAVVGGTSVPTLSLPFAVIRSNSIGTEVPPTTARVARRPGRTAIGR